MVDVTGLVEQQVQIVPDVAKMELAGISLEEIQDMTMTEIRDLIWKYSQEKFQENPMSGDSENMEGSQECPLDGSQDSSAEENSLKHLHGHHGQSEDE